MRRFLAAAEGDDNYPLWRLAANTGMRRGEVLGLRWHDVDFAAGRVAIRQQLVRAGKAPAFGPPKTRAGRRSITLDTGTVAALRAQQRSQAKPRLLLGAGYQDNDLVFCRADGTPLVSDSLPLSGEAGTAQLGSASAATEIATSILPHTTDAVRGGSS